MKTSKLNKKETRARYTVVVHFEDNPEGVYCVLREDDPKLEIYDVEHIIKRGLTLAQAKKLSVNLFKIDIESIKLSIRFIKDLKEDSFE